MPKLTTLLFVSVLAIGSVPSLPRVCAEGSADVTEIESTCGDRYNALLTRAKAALTRGDQAGAVNSLVAAKAQLRVCQEREERNPMAAVAVAMNCP